MPLHGKIVVIKRSGGDGTEFPLTATCLFGRKPDCDIRIQLPQVSKEHCRIDFNENKEIILTNLSSVNPTRVNGEALQQSERLKHGDVITVIDRSFRFEYPPAPTPKKRSSLGAKTETFKVLQNQQVGATVATENGENGISEVSTDPHLKDGTNHENIQRPLEEDGLLQSKTASPFNDLYQMIKKSLDVKTPRKSSASVLQTPTSRFCTPKPASVRKNDDEKTVIYTEDEITPKKDEAKVSSIADETKEEAGNVSNETPKSVKKQPLQVPSTEMARPEVDVAENADRSEVTPQKRSRTPPQRFTACEVVEQISASPKSPVRRTSPRNSGKVETVKETSKKRKREELATDLPTSQMKRKRVSFGGFLCPELFDKRLPPNSPLCKGATPRRSLSVAKPKQSLLRRASAMGLLQDKKEHSVSPRTGKASPKSRSPSPKAPAKKSPSPARRRSPTVQGRFSVSHISTPEDAVTEEVALVTATPKIPLRRKSTSREAPSHAKILCKNSGISRASMKVKNSWADIVRFGHARAQVAAPAKKTIAKKTMKKTVSKPQTPARNLKGHVSTGHADSPVTIVVGRAHKQNVVHPTGAPPKLVTNIALFKKHTKMDEDLTGISEMLKTPGNERRKTSIINENNAPKTLVGGLGTYVVEPSVLNTPEESGEMMVSPLTVSSTVKDRSYNSDAVQRLFDNDQGSTIVVDGPAINDSSEQQCTDLKTTCIATPKLKPELPECLTGVKRIMKTPRQKAEPIEDLRGKILKTPKQKPKEQECLTGVKRMMTTPKQEAEPVEDIKVELLATPQPQAEPLEDQGKPLEALNAETNKVADQAPLDCDEDELVFAHEQPRDNVPTDVVHDVPQVDMETEVEANEVVVDDHLEELPSGPYDNQPSDAVEISQAAVDENLCVETPEVDTVDEKLSEDQPDVEAATIKVTEMDTTAAVESLVADAAEDCDEAVVPIPVRGRRVKKTDIAAPPAVRQTTRGRNAKSQRSPSDDQPEMAPEKALQTTLVTEISTEAVSDQMSSITENDSTPTEEEAVVKPARGRKSKQTPVEPPQPELNEVVCDKSLPADPQSKKSIPALEKPRRGRKSKPDTVEINEVVEDAVVAVETKQQSQAPVRAKRGRNAKQEEEKLESASVETTKSQEPAKKLRRTKKAEQNKVSEDQAEMVPEPESEQRPPVDVDHEANHSAALKPKRGRKAKQPEEAVESDVCSVEVTEMDSAVQKKSVRGRRAKLVESNLAEDKQETVEDCDGAVLPTPVRGRRGKKTEATAPPAENDATPTEEEAVVKPTRGRKSKQTPVEPSQPELNEVVADESLPADAQPQKSRRGRKPKPDMVELNEVAEDAVVAVETKQQSQAPVRAKRGRNAKQEEEKLESASVETTKSQEPAKKLRRTKKAEQDHGEEVQAIEMVVPEEAEAPLVAEPVKMEERAAKPRRVGRKATEVQELPAVDSTEGLQKKNSEPDAPVVKQSKARGAKTSVKNKVAQPIPAKKARRGAALPLEETNADSTVQVSEPASTSVEPAKRGRRAAAKAPAINATVASDQAKPTEDSSKAVEDTKTSKRSVKWKADFEETPVKAVRGRKSKLGGQVDPESKTVSKAAEKTEEMDLSDEVVEAQPVKRTRKGPKVADVTAEEAVSTSKVESVDAEALPKTRRGRSAKK